MQPATRKMPRREDACVLIPIMTLRKQLFPPRFFGYTLLGQCRKGVGNEMGGRGVMICLKVRYHLCIVLALSLLFGTQCFAQDQIDLSSEAAREQEEFYQLYPDLRAHKEAVQMAYDLLKQAGSHPKTIAEAHRALALRTYVLLNQNSGASSSQGQDQRPKIPYWQVLEMYKSAREAPELKDMSLPEFAIRMNDLTGSRAYDKGVNATWVERVAANIGITRDQGWLIVIVEALVGLILLVIIFRATSRSSSRSKQQDQSPVVEQSVWQRATRPAGIAATWASICAWLSMTKVHNVGLVERLGLGLLFSVVLALMIALPVYLIAVLSYRLGMSRRR